MGISQKLFNLIPNYSVKDKKTLTALYKIGDHLGRPMENRLIMGATAILTQPFIDEHNKRVDKDTARASRNRIIGKIIAGTTVGCIVRGGVYKLIDTCTADNVLVDRWDNLLTPRLSGKKVNPASLKNFMRNYKTGLATIIATVVMLWTNVAFDVPLTNIISNFLNRRDSKKKQAVSQPTIVLQSTKPIPTKDKFAKVFKINKGGQS